MTPTLRLNIDDFDQEVIDKIREMFPKGKIQISVAEMDETERIHANPVQHKFLLDAIAHARSGGEMVTMTLDELLMESDDNEVTSASKPDITSPGIST